MRPAEQTPRKRRFFNPNRQEGQASFEFLLMMPFFIMGILIVVDFGILMYEYVSVANASREGARFGAVNCGAQAPCSDAEIRTRAVERSSGILPAGSTEPVVTVRWRDREDANSTAGDRGDSVLVKIDHKYQFLFFPWSMQVTSCADMRLESNDVGGTVTPTTTLSCQ